MMFSEYFFKNSKFMSNCLTDYKVQRIFPIYLIIKIQMYYKLMLRASANYEI